MAQAINNVESLRRFRGELKSLADNLTSELRNVSSKLDNLSGTWKDKQFTEFKSQFDEDKKLLAPLSKEMLDYESNLNDLERKLRRYLDRNVRR